MSQLQESPEKVGPSLYEEMMSEELQDLAAQDPFEDMAEHGDRKYIRVNFAELASPEQREGPSDIWRSLLWAEDVWSSMPTPQRRRFVLNWKRLQGSTACSGQGGFEQILHAMRTQIKDPGMIGYYGPVVEASDLEPSRQQVLAALARPPEHVRADMMDRLPFYLREKLFLESPVLGDSPEVAQQKQKHMRGLIFAYYRDARAKNKAILRGHACQKHNRKCDMYGFE